MSAPAYRTYLDETLLPYFYCPGCGHGLVSEAINAALVALQPDPHKVVMVTDIGCSGLADKYFTTHAFHGLHGRSITYATGIKLANPELMVLVLMGDGGCGIGGAHLINAARRNIGITVVVFNNFNYGMTGGEHSVTTPMGGVTSSTPLGQLEQPMDICRTVAVNGASFTARCTTFDKHLPDLVASAIQNEGFSLVDVWELCTAYYVPNNRFSRSQLESTLADLNFQTGVIHQAARPEYSRAYRQSTARESGKEPMPARKIERKYHAGLEKRLEVIIAGAAGKKINSAATSLCRGAVSAGLWATQRNDYPVTVKSGHSVSEVILSAEKISYTGIARPGLVLLLFKEGLPLLQTHLAQMTGEDILIAHSSLLPIPTRAKVLGLDFSQAGRLARRKEYWATMALAKALSLLKVYPMEAFKEAVTARAEFYNENLEAIEAGIRLELQPG